MPVSVFFGPRFTTFDEKYTAFGEEIISDNQVVVLQFGVGTSSELGNSGKHYMFANAMTGVAFVDNSFVAAFQGIDVSSKSTEPVFDLNVGYQFLFKKFLSLRVRYRSLRFRAARRMFRLHLDTGGGGRAC